MAKQTALLLITLLAFEGLAAGDIVGPTTTSTPILLSSTDWTGTLTFPKFDVANAILEQIDLELTGAMQTTLTVTNNSPSGSTGYASTSLLMTVRDPGNNIPDVPQIDFTSPNYSYNLSSMGSVTSGLLTSNSTTTANYIDPSILAAFTGSGVIDLAAATWTDTITVNSGGNTHSSQVTQGSLIGRITYHYRSVPEPASASLLLLGAAALMRARRGR